MCYPFFSSSRHAVEKQGSGLPVLVYAHSMGTLVNFVALPKLATPPCAALFSGCALHVGPDSGSPLGVRCLYPVTQTAAAVHVARVMAAAAPAGDAAPIVVAGLMHSPAGQAASRADPRVFHGPIRNKTAYELLCLTGKCLGEGGLGKFPPAMRMAFHHGADDMLTLPSGSEAAFAACPCAAGLCLSSAATFLCFHGGNQLREAGVLSSSLLNGEGLFFLLAPLKHQQL